MGGSGKFTEKENAAAIHKQEKESQQTSKRVRRPDCSLDQFLRMMKQMISSGRIKRAVRFNAENGIQTMELGLRHQQQKVGACRKIQTDLY
jgi:hypothetical protein